MYQINLMKGRLSGKARGIKRNIPIEACQSLLAAAGEEQTQQLLL
jgi:hypothetical protein